MMTQRRIAVILRGPLSQCHLKEKRLAATMAQERYESSPYKMKLQVLRVGVGLFDVYCFSNQS